jgi:putative addiction module component (TIGR02574 family)
MSLLDAVEAEALRLPKDQRLTLAHRIMASVEPAVARKVESAWEREILQRIKRYDSGVSKGRSGKEVFAELDQKLKK